MKEVGVIIPTTGTEYLKKAVESVLNQTYKNTKLYVVVDGRGSSEKANFQLKDFNNYNFEMYYLRENTGKNGQNGHRIYSAFSFLINSDYICYLDEDNWYDETHIESCVDIIQESNLDWCYSLRKIVSKEGNYICNDEAESLGKYNLLFDYNLVDTSCYFIKKNIAMLAAPYFVGEWGHDRRYYAVLSENFNKFDTTGKYTLNYRLGSNNNLQGEFFINSNNVMESKLKGHYPWRK